MDYDAVIAILAEYKSKVIPIISKCGDLSDIQGKAPIIEIVYRNLDTREEIIELSKMEKDYMLSVGTILSIEEAKFCKDNGIRLIFSPHFDSELVTYCIQNNMTIIPGVFTPSEIMAAYKLGVKIVKFFPCHSEDNINALKQYSKIFDKLGIKFIATGGVNVSNYEKILSIPNVIAVGSSSIKLLIS